MIGVDLDQDQEFKREFSQFCCAVRRFANFCDRESRESGITGQRFLLLLAIHGLDSGGQVPLGDIVDCLQTPRSAASHVIDASLRAGHITRQDDAADRRRALIALTPAGEQILHQVSAKALEYLRQGRDDIFRDALRDALR